MSEQRVVYSLLRAAARVGLRLLLRPTQARSYVFDPSDDDLRGAIEAVDRLVRERAIAADRAAETSGEGSRVGITFAAAPLEEDR